MFMANYLHYHTSHSTLLFCRSICVKDQLSDFLPALLQIMNGIEATGLIEVIKKSPEIWQPVFGTNKSFLDEVVAIYSDSPRKQNG